MNKRLLASLGCLVILALAPARAQQEVITSGSGDVSAGGKPAARAGDTTSSGNVVTGGSSNVFINGKPAATTGGTTSCGGLIVGGTASVIVNGKPLAGAGGSTTGCAGE